MFSDEDSDIFERSDEDSSDICIPLSPIADRQNLDELQRKRIHEPEAGTSSEVVVAKKCKTQENCELIIGEELLFSDEEEEVGHQEFRKNSSILDIFPDEITVRETSNELITKVEQNPIFETEQNLHDSFDDSDEQIVQDSAIDTKENDSEDSFDESIEFEHNIVPDNSIGEFVDEYSELEKKLLMMDKLANQLKIAATLRKESENQTEKDNLFPCKIENRYLSSGSQILLLNIQNNSGYVLKDWIITISWKVLGKHEMRICSRSIQLDTIEAKEARQFELFILAKECTSLFFQAAELHRVFEIEKEISCFRIPLYIVPSQS